MLLLICRLLHKKEFAAFAKYNRKGIQLDFNKMKSFESSVHAKRYQCNDCNNWICMIYNNSDNIWLVVDHFLFPYNDMETYDIYK